MSAVLREAAGSSYSRPGKRTVSMTTRWGWLFILAIVAVWGASFAIGFEVAVAVLTVAGLLAAIFGLRQPALGLLGIGVICAVDAPAKALFLTGGLWRFNMLNYWLLVVVLLSLPFLVRFRNLQTRLLQAFLLVLVLYLTISSDLRNGANEILNILSLFGLVVYFASAVEDGKVWYWLALVSGTVSAVGGLSLFLQLDRLSVVIGQLSPFPLTGLFAVCLALPFTLTESRGRISFSVLALLVLASVNLVWILITGSRAALSISLLCLAFLALEIPGSLRRTLAFAFAAVIALVVSTQFVDMKEWALGRVQVLFDPEYSLAYRTSGRSDLLLGGWHLFLDNPMGIGTGSFPKAWASLGDLGGLLTTRHVGREAVAHSSWMTVLVENGVLGLAALAVYIFSFAFVGWTKSKENRSLFRLGMLVAGVLTIGFLSLEFSGKALWFLIAGATVLLHKRDVAVLRGLSSE